MICQYAFGRVLSGYMARNDIENLRRKIDEADTELLDILKERMDIVDEIGELKRAENIEARDERRRGDLLSDRVSKGKNRGLSGEFVRNLFERIMDYAEERQQK